MDTLALTSDWDLALDDRGSLATFGSAGTDPATGPGMRMAQDVAARLMAWRGEVWMDSGQGLDYPRYLGQTPSTVALSADFQTEAGLVPEVATALVDLSLSRAGRVVSGTVYLTDINGYAAEVAI